MTTSIGISQLLSNAEKSAQSAASTQASGSTISTSTDALASLGSNSTEFLTLLTTQLKNQDPSSPTNTDQLTTELAQFAGVEQQVQTNTNLGKLISLTQEEQVTDSQALVGQTAQATTNALPLQNGQASFTFDTSTADPVAVAITDSSGKVVKTDTLTSQAGTNTYSWNGVSDSGTQLADGAYYVAIEDQGTSGSQAAITPTISGTITGVSLNSGTVDVSMGGVSVPMANVIGLANSDKVESAGTS